MLNMMQYNLRLASNTLHILFLDRKWAKKLFSPVYLNMLCVQMSKFKYTSSSTTGSTVYAYAELAECGKQLPGTCIFPPKIL